MAMRMSDTATNKYLSKIADSLAVDGTEAVPIGTGIPLDKVEEYTKKNNVILTIIGDSTGLRYWPGENPIRRNIQSEYGCELSEQACLNASR